MYVFVIVSSVSAVVIFAIIDRFIPGFLLVGYYRPMKRVVYRSLCLPLPSSEDEDDDEQKKER
jgi:hypothetical protein